jgi:TatD DNase family protein
MIDTHAHLEADNFADDRHQVIERFFQQQGRAIVTVGVDEQTNQQARALAGQYQEVYAAIGFHPEEAIREPSDQCVSRAAEYLRSAASDLNVVAIGEIGLDFHHIPKDNIQKMKHLQEFQKMFLTKQLNVARELDLPVVIHCRDAYDELFTIISETQYQSMKMVLHCYGGTIEQTKIFLELPQVFFSFTGIVTFVKPEAELLQVIQSIPLERIMVETDSPLLAPVPMRGKRNEPAYVRFVIDAIARLMNLPAEIIERSTDKTAIDFFDFNHKR